MFNLQDIQVNLEDMRILEDNLNYQKLILRF